MFLTGISRGYDTTLIGYLVATLIFSISLFRDKLFDTITVAKDLAVDDLDDGLIVLDNESTVLYYNNRAKHIYGELDNKKQYTDIFAIQRKMENDDKNNEIESLGTITF